MSQKRAQATKRQDFIDFKKVLTDSKRILISTHQLPDGDGLGAESALYHYLKKSKKSVRIYNPDRLPVRYNFLDVKKSVLTGPGQVEIWDTFDLWVIVDTNDPRRLGKLWGELSLRAKKIIFLDHHPNLLSAHQNISYPPHANVVSDIQSSSIGELLSNLFQDWKATKINKEIALGLYVSVMTDTNSFRYSRTTPTSHRIAAEMIELGINPEEVYQNIYSSKQPSHIKLLGHMLKNVKVGAKGKLAWLEMDYNLRKKHRASADDTQSFLNLLLLLRDAEIVCLFREEDNGEVRVSIKSKGQIIVNRVAMELGGGGHEFAAGLAVNAPLEKTIEGVTKRLEQLIDQFERFGKV